MARESMRSGAERLKYGICLNDECPKCKSKDIQQIPMRKELVCEECGKELRECPPPKKKNKKPLFFGLAAIVVAMVVGGILAISRNSEDSDGVSPITNDVAVNSVATKANVSSDQNLVVKSDTIIVRDTIVQNNTITTNEQVSTETVVSTTVSTPPKASGAGNGMLRLSYGIYSGATKGGYPHGQGRLTYFTTRQINCNDTKERTANAGDYVIGEFFNGFVVYGKHYDSDGNLLESLNFGVGSENSYESK